MQVSPFRTSLKFYFLAEQDFCDEFPPHPWFPAPKDPFLPRLMSLFLCKRVSEN